MTEIYNHELRGCRCVYVCLAFRQQTTPSCFYTLMCICFSFLQPGKPGGAVLKQPYFELMSLVLYPHLQPFPSSAAVSCHFLFFSPVLALQKTVPLFTLGWQLREETALYLQCQLGKRTRAVTQREPRHHLMVGIPSLTQTAGMRGVSGLASKCFALLYIWG